MLAAFGRPAQAACTLLIFIITFLTPVAYLILLRGLLSPIIEAYITHRALSPWRSTSSSASSPSS